MRISIHIGHLAFDPDPADLVYPENKDGRPLLPGSIVDSVQSGLKKAWKINPEEMIIVTTSPLVLDFLRFRVKQNPKEMEVSVHWSNGAVSRVDDDGRMDYWGPEFAVHEDVLCQLLA